MNPVKIVAVRVAGDGVFVEFADGLGSFFPGSFLESHRENNPNLLFVTTGELAATVPDFSALPLPSDRQTQPSLTTFLVM